MRIAIPLAKGILAPHFGHCEKFALIDADPASGKILTRTETSPPPHEPGLFPAWLADRGATHIIAGGMGQRAQGLFAQNGIQVLVGAPDEPPEVIVTSFLAGSLRSGENLCDH